MFEKFDGSGRAPRPAQVEALQWLEKNWSSEVLAMCLPTGIGKSAILRSILNEVPESAGLIPSNVLLNDGYRSMYPDLNYLIGLDNYKCENHTDLSCGDRKELKQNPCKNCPYMANKERALREPTIFNPISYYFFTQTWRFEPPKVLVVDEAHKLASTVMLLVDISFRKGRYSYPEIKTDLDLIEWLAETANKLAYLAQKYKIAGDFDQELQYRRQAERLEFVLHAYRANPQDFVFYECEADYRNKKEQYLCLVPVRPPSWILKNILKAEKLILMSATLMNSDLWELSLKKFAFLSLSSPIPKENRPILYIPSKTPMNYTTPPEDVARYISNILELYPNRNTIVHVS